MKYHKWKQIQNTKGTNYQECKKCEIIRSYQLGRWVFTFRGVVIKSYDK